MNLREYIDKTGIPISKLARRCGTSRLSIYAALRGDITVIALAEKISKETLGQVSIEELLRPTLKGRSERDAQGRWRKS